MLFNFRTLIIFLSFFCLVGYNVNGQFVKRVASFEENKGQLTDQFGNPNDDVLFLFRGDGMNVQLRSTGFSYDLFQFDSISQADNSLDASQKYSSEFVQVPDINFHRIDVDFVDMSTDVTVVAGNSQGSRNIYNNMTGGRNTLETLMFSSVLYQNVYPGIDLQFEIVETTAIKFNFIVHPGADFNSIKLQYSGAPLDICDNKLCFETAFGNFTEQIPLSFFEEDAEKHDLNFGYHRSGDILSFETDIDIDETKTLVIDPLPNVAWSTYCGSTAGEIAYITMTDNSGNVFMVGRTGSSVNIATAGAHQTTFGGTTDGMLAKYDSNGTRLWGTYVGGTGSDIAFSMDLDSGGNIYICGSTLSATNIATAGTQQPSKGLNVDAFLIKFNPLGARLWGTYMGFNGDETSYSVVIRNDTEIYMCGETSSASNIATGGVVQPGFGGGTKDAFVARYTNAGMRSWATFYGGSANETLYSIDVHTDGTLVAGGTTLSTNSISTAGSYQVSSGGSSDGFIVCLNSTGTVRNWASYFGGSGTESITSVDIDVNMYVVFGGNTASGTGISTVTAFQTTFGGVQDAFVGMFYLPGGGMQWATYLGGVDVESLFGVVTDGWGYVYAVGATSSTSGISTADATQVSFGGGANDGFMVIYGHVGFLQWGTYFGGLDNDAVLYIWPIVGPGAYICGATTSASGIATAGAAQTVFGGGGFQDAFLAKLANLILPVEFVDFEVSGGQSRSVQCRWVTASEVNNHHFEIERSMDNLNFSAIGSVQAVGNSFELNEYHFEDEEPNRGWLYYRVKQIDTNGDYSYSDVKPIWNDMVGEVFAYPNPTKDFIKFNFSQASLIQVFSSEGKIVLEIDIQDGVSAMDLDLSRLPSGIFHAKFTSSSGEVNGCSFIKE